MQPSPFHLDIVAYSGTNTLSRLIKLRTLSRYSHVGMAFWANGEHWIVESMEGKGCRIVPLRLWHTWGGKVSGFSFNEELFSEADREAMLQFCLRQVGQEYASPKQLIRAFMFGARWLADKLHWPIDEEGWTCSELMVAAMQSVGKFNELVAAESSPGDIPESQYVRRASSRPFGAHE